MENKELHSGMQVQAKESYEIEFKKPIKIIKGDELHLIKYSKDDPGWVFCRNEIDQEGWVPESAIIIIDEKHIAKHDYSAQELRVQKGEIVLIQNIEYTWAWVTNNKNEHGWVPIKILS